MLSLSTFVLWSLFYLQIVRDVVISFFTTFLADHLVLFFSRFLSSSLVVHHFVLVFIASSLQAATSFVLLFCSALFWVISYLLATLFLVFYACFRKITQFISYKYSSSPPPPKFLSRHHSSTFFCVYNDPFILSFILSVFKD